MPTIFNNFNDVTIAERLVNGEIGVIPTDTLYGFHCLSSNKDSVNKIYNLKGRDFTKPFIVLISSYSDLLMFGVKLSHDEVNKVSKFWPGPYSIILPIEDTKFEYLHKGLKSIAFRMPNKPDLLELIKKTGPLVSTSVNRSGEPSVKSFDEAYKIFGESVDFYINEGILDNPPSTVIKFDGKDFVILRK
jgi:L-threonylcarbamoyladenylate synthase